MRALEAARQLVYDVRSTATVAEAAGMMAAHGVRALVVQDDGRPLGIVTERDLVVRAMARKLEDSTPVERIMTPSPVTIEASASAAAAYALLRERGVRQVPLVEDGRVVGLLNLVDLVSELTGELLTLVPEPERFESPSEPMGFGVGVLHPYRHCPHCGGEQLRAHFASLHHVAP